MPVEHIVLLKTSRPIGESEHAAIMGLASTVPGVISVSVGDNYTDRGLGYSIGIVVRLTSKEAEAAYQTHPEHVRVRDTIIKPLLRQQESCGGYEANNAILAVDYVHQPPLLSKREFRYLLLGFMAGAAVALQTLQRRA